MSMNLPDNIWLSPVIKKRLLMEAGFESTNHGRPPKAQYWFSAPMATDLKSRMGVTLKNYVPGVFDVDPHDMQMAFASELRWRLQQNIGHDGLWIAGWTHPPGNDQTIRVDGDNAWNRLVMVWLDGDGDPQFTVESDLPFVEMISRGGYYYIEMAEEAYQAYVEAYGLKAMKDDLGLGEDQMTKAALAALK